MRPTGLLHPTDGVPIASDYIQNIVATAGSTTYVFDWPASTAGSTGPAGFVGFSGNVDFFVSYNSTRAAIPSSFSTGSSGFELNPSFRQIPGDSTGGSIVCVSSGHVSLSYYRK